MNRVVKKFLILEAHYTLLNKKIFIYFFVNFISFFIPRTIDQFHSVLKDAK
jgi:hypothetical protein